MSVLKNREVAHDYIGRKMAANPPSQTVTAKYNLLLTLIQSAS